MANDFNQTVSSLFHGMDSLLSTKTVVGEPTKVGDTIILPLVDVNFGVAAGAFGKNGNINRRNYCRAGLILVAIGYVIAIIIAVIAGIATATAGIATATAGSMYY